MIFTLTKHTLCHSGQCCYYIETSPLIYGANQWYGFYTMATLDSKKLILTTAFSIYYFFCSWRNPLSPSVQETLFSKFYVLLNTTQIIKLYTYPNLLKENPLLKKFLNWESTAYFLDETYHYSQWQFPLQ